MGVLAATGLLALGAAATAFAESSKNAGDVWTDNVGQPPGPGHEHDPHLACQNINLWGSGLADPSGKYVIDGWPPSGSQEKDYEAEWSYDQSLGGSQVISEISVTALIKAAEANGDAPINGQGYHFKLQFGQDPQKHKTFWVNCLPAPAPKEGGEGKEGGGGKEGTPGGTSGATNNTPPGATNTPAPGSPAGTPVIQAPNGSVKATHKSRKHRKLVRAKRHLKPRKRHVSADKDATPKFTG